MIKLRDVGKTYFLGEHSVKALRDVNLDIEEGEFIAIVGPSGSGKSTLMNILGCLDRPSHGEYVLDDVDIADLSDDQLSVVRNRAIGFVFQSFNLLPRLPAYRQVELPLIYRGIRNRTPYVQEALNAVGLADRYDHKPSELSGGEQQRVAIARAIISRPALILADEPTGNLDSRTSLEILWLFKTLNRTLGITVIYVTHERDIAEHAQRIIRFHDGLIVSDERVDAPRNAEEALAELGPPQEAAAIEAGAETSQ